MEKSDFGRKLKEVRVAAGLSRVALAKMLGVPQSAVSQWETGIHLPSVTDLPDLATALGVDPGELFKPASSEPATPRRGRPPKPTAPPAAIPKRRGK